MSNTGFVGTLLAFSLFACGSKVASESDAGATVTMGTAGSGGAWVPPTGGSSAAAGAPSFAMGGAVTAQSTGGSSATCDNSMYQPRCGVTVAGELIAKGIACVSADPQLCYKTCGPGALGSKSETCTGGVYMEQSDCSYPIGPNCDYSCYKIPAISDAACPSTAPQYGSLCNIPPCVVCGVETGYLDTKGSEKLGYCVCLPATATSTQKWACAASGTSWPCPGNPGC